MRQPDAKMQNSANYCTTLSAILSQLPNCAGMCQPITPSLSRAPAALGTGLLSRVPVAPSDFTGSIESSDTIQPALLGDPHCCNNHCSRRLAVGQFKALHTDSSVSWWRAHAARTKPYIQIQVFRGGAPMPHVQYAGALFVQWGASISAGMCQPIIPALFRAPALLNIGLLESPSMPSDFTGTTEVSGTI